MSHQLAGYLKAEWNAPCNVHAYTTLRTDGFSTGAYHSFNLADHVGDEPSAVLQNRQKLQNDLSLQQEPLWLQQVHGKTVIYWKDATLKNKIPEADASFTQLANHPCVVLTADCLPIVICHREGTMVAAIHAGWKGIINGVIEATVESICEAMKTLTPSSKNFLHEDTDRRGELTSSLLAWIGPAIGPEAFEVDAAVRDQFIQQDPQAEKAFQPGNPGKWYGNIFLLGKQRLMQMGIIESDISGGYISTYQATDSYFSARRDKETGRMATLIWLT